MTRIDTTDEKEYRMIRVLHVSLSLLVLTGHALAQVTPPVANVPGAAQSPGRASFPPVVIGPAASVPPEVAIPRPTPEELAQVNKSVMQWIAADKSPAKPLL